MDGTHKKERFVANINGQEVLMRPKPFIFLVKLAYHRKCGEGWLHKDELEEGNRQSRYIYRMKQEIEESLGTKPVIENVRGGYYRLNLNPKNITLNETNLQQHYDFSIRQLFKKDDESIKALN